MKRYLVGLPTARAAGSVWLAAMLLYGCGTHTPGSTGQGSTATSSARGNAVPGGAGMGLLWSANDATLRPLIGVPGAVRLGAALFPAGAYISSVYSAATGSALILDAHGNLQLVTAAAADPVTILRGVAAASIISFSPRGGYAVVFSAGASSLQLISGVTQQPSVSTVNAGAALRGAAVSDAGTVLLATNAAGAGVTITAIPANGAAASLASLQGLGGMAFVPGSDDVLVADSVANTLVRLHSGTSVMLASSSSGLNHPLAVAASADGQWGVTVNQADGMLVRADLSGATPPLRSSCACSPTGLLPLAGSAVFEIVAPGPTPGWMFEADAPTPRVLFIPPARSQP